MEDVWYKNGLRFTCTQCGDCCTGEPGFVWVNEDEMQAIADSINEPIDSVIALYTRTAHRGRSLREKENGDCVFLSDKRSCTIYPVRPRQCRTWPFWHSNLDSEESWQHTCEICPGSGHGELISVEEISKRIRVIRL